MSGSARISPTAHYTGQVWRRHGLSPPAFGTREGRLLYESLRPTMLVAQATGRPTLEPYLLARHRALDALVERAISRDGVSQVLELAAGLSPRGWRFCSEHHGIVYIEADLPGMAARKRAMLARAQEQAPPAPAGEAQAGPAFPDARRRGLSLPRVVEVDVLQESPDALAELFAGLDPERGLVVITEGLLSYLDRRSLQRLWERLASLLAPFRQARYVSDLHLESDETPVVRWFRGALGLFVRGTVQAHFAQAGAAQEALRSAGFVQARVLRAHELAGGDPAPGYILEASMS